MKLNAGKGLVLNQEFRTLLKEMETDPAPLFITGRAGTGKSTLLQLFRRASPKNVAVVAPTGIAALNVRGQTIHSFFGFPPKLLHPEDIYRRRNRSLYKNLEVLVIDEISMVRADLLDAINVFLQKNRDNYLPFGGVKVIFFGDLFQLPPVIATQEEKRYLVEHYETPYFFSSHVFTQEFELVTHELTEVFRQTDRNFINILDNIRMRAVDYDDLEQLNNRYKTEEFNDDFFITLCTRKAQAQSINREKLAELESEEFTYIAKVSGDFSDRLFPTSLGLKLRVGAQVMFNANDPNKEYVNGTIGKIVNLDTDRIDVNVKKADGSFTIISVQPFTWEIIKYIPDTDNKKLLKSKAIGSFTQYPLRLAWAITIHKSQGKTFDRVKIDLGKGAFESGQTYVALSRCRSLEGIVLSKKLRPQDIMVDPIIADFYQRARY